MLAAVVLWLLLVHPEWEHWTPEEEVEQIGEG